MSQEDFLENRFRNRLRSGPISYSVEMREPGLVFGAGTCLARMTGEATRPRGLALVKDAERIVALLSIIGDRRSGIDSLRSIKAASDDWERGDKALANIRLAQAALPRIADAADAYRLFLAEELLDQGTSPRSLLKALGLDAAALDLIKYDPNQPRVPAGNGRESGRWGSGGGTNPDGDKPFNPTVTIREATISQPSQATNSGIVPTAAVAIAATTETLEIAGGTGVLGEFGEALFTAAEGSAFLANLATLGAVVGAGAVLGAIFVPSPNDVSSKGAVPGDPDLHYALDNDTGTLRLTRQSDAGAELVALAHRGRDGIFFEADTGIPITRIVGGSLVFDAASLADESEDDRSQAGAIAAAQVRADAKSNPQLCPDPGPDVPHGASARAIAYQAQISALNNPERPLPPGLAVSLPHPKTGKRVVFDDCRETDGTMIEAKGPGYARLLRSAYFRDKVLPYRWIKQAERQAAAAADRDIDWFFAEKTAADHARELFNNNGLGRIRILTVAPGV